MHSKYARPYSFMNKMFPKKKKSINLNPTLFILCYMMITKKAAGAGRFRVLDGIGKVERICVLKENRKTGAGVAVMNKIEEYAKSQGISTLKLNAQTHAIPFYSNLGYETVSEEFMDAGIPHKTMKKSI